MNKLLRQTATVDGPHKQQSELNSGIIQPSQMGCSLGDTIRYHNQDILTAGIDLYGALTVSLLNYLDMNERYRHRICTQFGLDLLVLRPEARISIVQVDKIQLGIHVHAHMLLQHASALDAIIRPRLYSTTPLFAAVSSGVRASLPQSPLLINNFPYPKVTSIGHGIFFSDGLSVFLQEQVYQHFMLNMERFEELYKRRKLVDVVCSRQTEGNKQCNQCKYCGKQFVRKSADLAASDASHLHHPHYHHNHQQQQGSQGNNLNCSENGSLSTAKVGHDQRRQTGGYVCQHEREIGNCSVCAFATDEECMDICNECIQKARMKSINSCFNDLGVGSLYEHCDFLKRLNYYAIDIEHLILKALAEIIRCAIVVLYSVKQQSNCKLDDDSQNKDTMFSIYIPHRPHINLTKNLISGGVELICLAKNEYNQHFDEAVVSIGSAGWHFLQTHIMSQVQSEKDIQGQYERETSNQQTNGQSVDRRENLVDVKDVNSSTRSKLSTPTNFQTKALNKSGNEKCKGINGQCNSGSANYSLVRKHSHDDNEVGSNFDGARKSDMKHRLQKTKEKLKHVFGKSKDSNAAEITPTLTGNLLSTNYNFESVDPQSNLTVNPTTLKGPYSDLLMLKSFQQNQSEHKSQITYDNVEPSNYNEIKQYPNKFPAAFAKNEKDQSKLKLQGRFIGKTDNIKSNIITGQNQSLFVPTSAPLTANATKDTTCKDNDHIACGHGNFDTTFPRISSAISALTIPTMNSNGAKGKSSEQLNCAERSQYELNNLGTDVKIILGDNSIFAEAPFLMTSNEKKSYKEKEKKSSEFVIKSKPRDPPNTNSRQLNEPCSDKLNPNTSFECSIGGSQYIGDKQLTTSTKEYSLAHATESTNLNNTSIPIARIISSFPRDTRKDENRVDTGLPSISTDNDSSSVVNDVYHLMLNSHCSEERPILREHGSAIMDHLQNTKLEDHEKDVLMRALLGKALTDNDKDKIKNIIGFMRKENDQDNIVTMLSGRSIRPDECCTFNCDQPNVHENNERKQYRSYNPEDKQLDATNIRNGHRQSTLILLENLSKSNFELLSVNSAYGVAKGYPTQRSDGTQEADMSQLGEMSDSFKNIMANERTEKNKSNTLQTEQTNKESAITKPADNVTMWHNNNTGNQKVCELNQRTTTAQVDCEAVCSAYNSVTNSCFNAIAASMIIATQNNPCTQETLEHRLRLKPFTFSTSTNFDALTNLITKRLQRLTLREWKRNKYRYVNYMYGFEFEKEIEKFAETGICCSQLENAIPLAVANSVGVEIQIITSLREYPLLQVTPDRFMATKKRMIVLMLALDQCEGSSAIYNVAVPKHATDVESVASSKLSKSNKSVTFSETTEVRTFERSEEEKKDILEWQIERGRNKKDKNGMSSPTSGISPDYRMAIENPDLEHLKQLNMASMQLLTHPVPQSVQNRHLTPHPNFQSTLLTHESAMAHYLNSLNASKLQHQLVPNPNNPVMHLPDGGGKHILSAFPIGGYVPNFTSYFPL